MSRFSSIPSHKLGIAPEPQKNRQNHTIGNPWTPKVDGNEHQGRMYIQETVAPACQHGRLNPSTPSLTVQVVAGCCNMCGRLRCAVSEGSGGTMTIGGLLRVAVLSACTTFVGLPSLALAQSGTTGAIAGEVKDATGAVLPGVTVEAASPALIEKVRTVVTDASGRYQIVDLRPGVYTVTFQLPGFSTVRREGLELNTGFTATVDADMRVGGVEETITVIGASPVVDITNTRQQNVLTREVLDTLPTSKSVQALAAVTLGALTTGCAGRRRSRRQQGRARVRVCADSRLPERHPYARRDEAELGLQRLAGGPEPVQPDDGPGNRHGDQRRFRRNREQRHEHRTWCRRTAATSSTGASTSKARTTTSRATT